MPKIENGKSAVPQPSQSDIAIVGYSCRLPNGANSPDAYWEKLINGVNCTQTIPDDRWTSDPQVKKSGKNVAGLIDDIDKFDADFFGIFPREAASMDPQQRLLLEVSWEAIEHAGIQHDQLLGSKTGVFIGSVALDYRDRFAQMAKDHIDTYALTGNLLSIQAGRLSYVLGLEGPCSTIETACSSSLVAVHEACQNLLFGECDMALAGGVNVLLSPVGMELLDKAKTLSTDGKCWAFDEKANGLVRGEGCGIVVLKRVEDAQRDNDDILAIIKGTVINHDGRAASLSSPSVLAQQKLLKKALEVSCLNAEDIGYVETHGTGTPLGDPIEVQAIRSIYGGSRMNSSYCYLGSVKSNIGHLEGAAGIAGMIKTILALKNKTIPPQINFEKLNPAIDLKGSCLKVSKKPTPWKVPLKMKRVAGVSSFGISGTNAHAILTESPNPVSVKQKKDQNTPYTVTLSAKNPDTLRGLAQKYMNELHGKNTTPLGQASLKDISYSTQARRSHYKNRLAITAIDKDDLKGALEAYTLNKPHTGLRFDDTQLKKCKIAFVFPGLGAQWDGMGRDLFHNEPVFKKSILACEEVIQEVAGWSLIDRLNFNKKSTSTVTDITSVQICMFALSVALVDLWKSWGIKPRAVVGHSLGEVSAAYAGGLINLSTAIQLVYSRSKILEQLQNTGSMAIMEATWDKAEELVKKYKGLVTVAGANSPRLILLSGDNEKLQELWRTCHENQIFFRIVKGSAPSHSPQLDPFLPELRKEFSSIEPLDSKVSFYSAWQGKLLKSAKCDSEYWINNLRQPVLFHQALSQMLDDGYTHFVEISPHPTLQPAITEIAQQKGVTIKTSSSLRDGVLDRHAMQESLGELYVSGTNVDWTKQHTCDDEQYIRLPSYPWNKERHWIEEKPIYFKTSGPNIEPSNTDATLASDNDFLHVDWSETELLSLSPAELDGQKHLILLGADTPEVQQFRQSLESKGYHVIHASPKGLLTDTKSSHIVPLDMQDSNSFTNLFRGRGTKCVGVVNMLSFTNTTQKQEDFPQETLDLYGCTATMHLLQAMNQLSIQSLPSLTLVTNNAKPVTPISNISGVVQSALWGMAESLRYEFPDLKCKCIDLSDGLSRDEIELLLSEIWTNDNEEQVAYRSSKRYVARLQKGLPKDSEVSKKNNTLKISKNGTYVISGGLGGLGLELSKWLVEQGAGTLVLLSRSGPKTEEQEATLRVLRDKGTLIKTPKLDISDYSSLETLFKDFESSIPPIKGIIHAAGTLEDGFTLQQTHESFRKVFAPKVDGAFNLHRVSKGLDLDFFIMYSSASTTIGSPGQANYSAANACLDALSHYRLSQGLPSLAINWGVFKDVGLATADPLRADRLERRGVAGINFKTSLEVLQKLLHLGIPNIGFMPFNVRQWTEFYPHASSSSYLSNLTDFNLGEAPKQAELITTVMETPKDRQLSVVSIYIQNLIGSILQQNPNKLDLETPFSEFGMDSLTGLELRNLLEASSGQKLPATLIWTYTHITALAEYILSLLSPGETDSKKPTNDDTPIEDNFIEYLKKELSE